MWPAVCLAALVGAVVGRSGGGDRDCSDALSTLSPADLTTARASELTELCALLPSVAPPLVHGAPRTVAWAPANATASAAAASFLALEFQEERIAWSKLQTSATPPSQRSGACTFVAHGSLYVYGGCSAPSISEGPFERCFNDM